MDWQIDILDSTLVGRRSRLLVNDGGDGNVAAASISNATGHPQGCSQHDPLGKAIRDGFARFGVTGCFGGLALGLGLHANAVLHAGGGINALNLARMLSCVCLSLDYILIVWLTLARNFPVKQASGLQPRATATLGTFLTFGLAFMPARAGLSASWHFASASLLLSSSVLLLLVLPHLGTSFSIMPEARSLVISGPYAIVRHPVYLVEEIAVIGVFVQLLSVPAMLLVIGHFGFQLGRIYNEEAVLVSAFPEYYPAYQSRTARLIPGIW